MSNMEGLYIYTLLAFTNQSGKNSQQTGNVTRTSNTRITWNIIHILLTKYFLQKYYPYTKRLLLLSYQTHAQK